MAKLIKLYGVSEPGVALSAHIISWLDEQKVKSAQKVL